MDLISYYQTDNETNACEPFQFQKNWIHEVFIRVLFECFGLFVHFNLNIEIIIIIVKWFANQTMCLVGRFGRSIDLTTAILYASATCGAKCN